MYVEMVKQLLSTTGIRHWLNECMVDTIISYFFKHTLYSKINSSRDGILGRRFDKSLESFAPCYSLSFYWRIFKENQTLQYSGFINAYKKSAKQENSNLFVDSIL
jgi:hypothetical protein